MKGLGDTQAFDELYRAEFSRLAGALALMCGDRMIGEELAQETFVRAWTRWRRVAALDRPAGWLYTTGFRLAARQRRRPRPVRPLPEDPTVNEAFILDRLQLLDALRALPPRQAQAVVLRHVLGFPSEAAAEIMGLSSPGFRQLVHRGVVAVRTTVTSETHR